MFISCEDVKKLIKEQQAQLVDVRTANEFLMSNLPGSTNIDLYDIERDAESLLNKELPVIVFCQSGQRSHLGKQTLLSLGFKEVHNMGSYLAWSHCHD